MENGTGTLTETESYEDIVPVVRSVRRHNPRHGTSHNPQNNRQHTTLNNHRSIAETQPPENHNDTLLERFCEDDAANALENFARAQEARAADLEQFSTSRRQDDNDNEDTNCPILTKFISIGGRDGIHSITNFSVRGFFSIWDRMGEHITKNWNTGRGKKSCHSGKDVLFMLLATLKHGGQWDWLGKMFGISGATFQRLIMSFVRATAEKFVQLLIEDWCDNLTMHRLSQRKESFINFPFARYATDVTFQPANRPIGNLSEGKYYFSGKHKAYGYKVEASVLPNGICIGVTRHYAGSVSDIDIMRQNEAFHNVQTKKQASEYEITDIGDLRTQYPDRWAILADKGYQGASQILRVIVPKKKPPRGSLTVDDADKNFKISSDRIIVENYFGRLCGLWTLFASQWRWSEDIYDDLFKIAVALTNCHIKSNPLRSDDGKHYNQIRNRLETIATERAEKRRRTQQRYRERRRRRLDQNCRTPTPAHRRSAFPAASDSEDVEI